MQRKIKEPRKRASVIVIDKPNRRFLMMYRRKKTKKGVTKKYVVPGGGVEKNESLEQAAIRELREETTLDVIIDKKITTIKYKNCHDFVFISNRFKGKPKLSGEELDESNENNYYEPKWIKIDDIDKLKIPIYPKSLVKSIKKLFR